MKDSIGACHDKDAESIHTCSSGMSEEEKSSLDDGQMSIKRTRRTKWLSEYQPTERVQRTRLEPWGSCCHCKGTQTCDHLLRTKRMLELSVVLMVAFFFVSCLPIYRVRQCQSGKCTIWVSVFEKVRSVLSSIFCVIHNFFEQCFMTSPFEHGLTMSGCLSVVGPSRAVYAVATCVRPLVVLPVSSSIRFPSARANDPSVVFRHAAHVVGRLITRITGHTWRVPACRFAASSASRFSTTCARDLSAIVFAVIFAHSLTEQFL